MKASFADESGGFEVYPIEDIDESVLELRGRHHIEAFLTSRQLSPNDRGIYRNDRRMGNDYLVMMCKCTNGTTVGIAFGRTEQMTITVKQLKDFIKDWPETDRNGEPSEVWVSTGPGLSSPCLGMMRLNQTDIILEPSDYTGEE